jgi:hypothetical protein
MTKKGNCALDAVPRIFFLYSLAPTAVCRSLLPHELTFLRLSEVP